MRITGRMGKSGVEKIFKRSHKKGFFREEALINMEAQNVIYTP